MNLINLPATLAGCRAVGFFSNPEREVTTMTPTKTNELLVTRIDWNGVAVAVNGETRWLDWDTLRASAEQDDAALRAVYAGVLSQAERMARDTKARRVIVWNFGGSQQDTGALTWAATVRTMAGEAVSARTIAADWGQTGSRNYAIRDVAEATAKLTAAGYEVR